MAQLIEDADIFYNPFLPKVQNEFIMVVDGIPTYTIKKVNRPRLECGEVVLDHINLKRKIKGKCVWGDIVATLYDPIVPSAAQSVMQWVRTGHESTTGRDGYPDFYQKDFDIYVLGPVGDKVENWKIKGAWIKSVDFGEMAWDQENPVEIVVTFAIQYAVLEY